MAITVCGNCVDFGSQSICIDPAGIYVSGRFDFAGCGLAPTQAQGTVSGYTSAGHSPSVPVEAVDILHKFPFSSDTSASDVAELSCCNGQHATQSSSISGYLSGGRCPHNSPSRLNSITKFTFASEGPVSVVGNLTGNNDRMAGQSGPTHGYSSGGTCPGTCSTIQKFPFSSDTNATDVGELSQAGTSGSGSSSAISGYQTGRDTPPTAPIPRADTIDKFPFSTDTPATDVGELTYTVTAASNSNSAENGYVAGGFSSVPFGTSDIINKFPFSSDTPATDIGEISSSRCGAAGASSQTDGYLAGGAPSADIDKYPFSADTSASDIGELTIPLQGTGGHQV